MLPGLEPPPDPIPNGHALAHPLLQFGQTMLELDVFLGLVVRAEGRHRRIAFQRMIQRLDRFPHDVLGDGSGDLEVHVRQRKRLGSKPPAHGEK